MNPSVPEGTVQLPPKWSTIAPEVDWMYYFIYWLSVVFTVGIFAAMIYFAWKYRRREGHKAVPTGHNFGLEIFWTFTPLLLLVFLFHRGFEGYIEGAIPPEDSVEIRVRGMQWNWEFEHAGGVIDEYNELKVPVDRPVHLIMSSNDVLHAFFIPTMRVKRDIVPGMFSTLWFEATHTTGEATGCETTDQCGDGLVCYYGNCIATCNQDSDCEATMGQGSFCGGRDGEEGRMCALPVFCAEYCGAGEGITRSALRDPDGSGRNTNHSTMMAELRIISQEGYDQFLAVGPPPPSDCVVAGDPTCESDECRACWGEDLYTSSGCSACHSTDGAAGPAPTWQGLWGSQRTFVSGDPTEANDEYIREAILQPQARIVDGFANVAMPAYRLSDNQLGALIAFMQTLDE